MGGYIAFFHRPVYMVSNFVMTAATGLVAAVRLGNNGEGVLALMTFWLVIELNVIVPLAIQTVVHALGIDLVQSDRDPRPACTTGVRCTVTWPTCWRWTRRETRNWSSR